jgi:hypothetical protein
MWCHRQPRRLAIVRCRSGCGRPGGRYRGAAQCQRLERQRGSGPACAMYLHHCGAIVCDCLATVGVDHEQVTAVRAESALDCRLDGEAGVDVGDDLSSALGLVGAYKDQHVYTEAASSHSPSRSTTIVGVWPPNDMMAVWKKRKLGVGGRGVCKRVGACKDGLGGYQANTAPLCYPPATRSQKLELRGAGAGAAD